MAARLSVPVEELADHVNYDSTLELSSVCAVLSATSVNKFKNRYPLGDVMAAACRAQARTIVSGVGDLFLNYAGAIVFQGGVASNRAVAHYLQAITGNRILIPELNQVMGALGAARIARDCWQRQCNSTGQARGETRATPLALAESVDAPPARSRNRWPCELNLTRQAVPVQGRRPLGLAQPVLPRGDTQRVGRPHVDAGNLCRLARPQRKEAAKDVRSGGPQGLLHRNLLVPPRAGRRRSPAEAGLRRRHQRTLPAGRAGARRSGARPGLSRPLPSRAHADPSKRPLRREHRGRTGGRRSATWSDRWA